MAWWPPPRILLVGADDGAEPGPGGSRATRSSSCCSAGMCLSGRRESPFRGFGRPRPRLYVNRSPTRQPPQRQEPQRPVAVLTHTGRPAAVTAANRLVEGLGAKAPLSCPPEDLPAIDPRLADVVAPLTKPVRPDDDIELMVVFGGDGTILTARSGR